MIEEEQKHRGKHLFIQRYGRKPDVLAYAPGRIEFLGNHTDYNGGLVLGVAINKGVYVYAAKNKSNRIDLFTTNENKFQKSSLDAIERKEGSESWGNYILGVLSVLKHEGLRLESGFSLMIDSDLPLGLGMSSSAALELATAYALSDLYQGNFTREQMVHMCRRAENEFVGVPCGILDQGVSAFGKPNAVVAINCQKHTFERIPLPSNLYFWVFDSGSKHALIDSLYTVRHEECMKAFLALQEAGEQASCLANIPPPAILKRKDSMPEALYKRALHVSEENERVAKMRSALEAGSLEEMGALLYASHESSKCLFENSTKELDFMVDLLKKSPNVYGARLTGGGFGGAVMAVCNAAFGVEEAATILQKPFKEKYQREASGICLEVGEGARSMPI